MLNLYTYNSDHNFITLLSNEFVNMSIKIKRQSLMGDSASKKKVKQRATNSQTKQAQSARSTLQQTTQKQVELTHTKNKKKSALWLTLALVTLIALFFPKPQLISYQKLNVVGTSIYWPGFFDVPATLFDSELTLAGNIEEGKIFLCDHSNQNVGCQKYQIVKQEGFISVLNKLISD